MIKQYEIIGNESKCNLNELFKFCKENYLSQDVCIQSDVFKAYRVYKERKGKKNIDLLNQDIAMTIL